MDCREYIENYVAAHADGELSPQELAKVEAHLAGCPKCRARLEEERALKALLRQRLSRAAAPEEVRAAVRTALNRAEAASSMRRDFRALAGRARIWGPVAALAALLMVVLIHGRKAAPTPTSDFDMAIERYTSFEKHFEPNVPSESAAVMAMHYHSAKMPAFIWDFEPYGFHLVGGRIERLADGRPATFTFYQSSKGALMCTRFQMTKIQVPPGGHELMPDQYAYSYKGFSLVLSVDPVRRWVCILMSRLPEAEFSKEVMSLEG
jgi:mycothiol system anti-sigma-R factor